MTEPNAEYEAQDKTIFRRAKDRDNPFVMIDRTIFSDEKVSWKAKGVLGYLLSKPDDWTVRMGDLVKRATDGQYATASAIRELEAHGYLTRYQKHDEQGHFMQLVIEVHEVPVAIDKRTNSPQSGFPLAGNPLAGNPFITNTDSTESDDTNIAPRAKKPAAADPLDFGLERKTEQAQAKTGNYAVPPEAGGADPWADRPVDAFAETLADIVPIMLPEKERKAWARQLAKIAVRWSTEDLAITPDIMAAAIRAVPDSDIGWKTYKSPYAGSFETDIGGLLLNGGRPNSDRLSKTAGPEGGLSPARQAILISRQHDEERRQRENG